jgi:hypothetical protein
MSKLHGESLLFHENALKDWEWNVEQLFSSETGGSIV